MLSIRLELNHQNGETDLYCPAVMCDFCGANGARWLSDELRLLPVRIATNLGIELRS